jgi:hypothetical protein
MKTGLIKKCVKAIFVAMIIVVGSATVLQTTAKAQHWRYRGGVVVTRPRIFINPGVRVYRYPRTYAYPYTYYAPYGYYSPRYYYTPRYDAGPADVAERAGYHDGFSRGEEDAGRGRRYDPNNSSHFRNSISSAYRDGFVRGYRDGYYRYAG